MKIYWWSGGIAPSTVNLDITWSWVVGQFKAPDALPPGKEPLLAEKRGKFPLCLTEYNAMKRGIGWVEVWLHAFLPQQLVEVSGQLNAPYGVSESFQTWVDNEINNSKHTLRSNTKCYGGKTY